MNTLCLAKEEIESYLYKFENGQKSKKKKNTNNIERMTKFKKHIMNTGTYDNILYFVQ